MTTTEHSSTTTPLAQRLHHNAFVTKDQGATRAFYEDILGFPLVATWAESDELFGAVRTYCHTFFGLADGSALAFFQFADPEDQELFDPELAPSPFRHIALKVDTAAQQELERRPPGSRRAGSAIGRGGCRVRRRSRARSPGSCPLCGNVSTWWTTVHPRGGHHVLRKSRQTVMR